MSDVSSYIRRYYDLQSEIEWQRLERHRSEFAVTMRALNEHLPPPPAAVLDCGGGPGRYAIELAKRGYQVTLFDLSAANLNLARQKAKAAGVASISYEQGDARDLSRFPDDAFDAVLLFGPLYHLLEEASRRQALVEAVRVLEPGGLLFAAYICRYAAHRFAAKSEPDWILRERDLSQRLLQNGVLPQRGNEHKAFVAYLAHPDEITQACRSVGLRVKSLLGVEGLVSLNEERVNELEGELWQSWVDLNFSVAGDPCLLGSAEHILAVAQKPRWRAALRNIAGQLKRVGLSYKLVGGASAALQGVDLPVADLDIECGEKDAYRFQELFPKHIKQAVMLSDNKQYLSHFGKFEFDGVQVDVMGDLHRHQAGEWVPSWTLTSRQINLEGVPLNVSWLEEETLAYIRRGRLQRAGLCLTHCDRERLLALIRGEQASYVI
jgi:ubiquinone/menaquinone biosynthesis C-methylase UbiE